MNNDVPDNVWHPSGNQNENSYVCSRCRRTEQLNVADYYWRDYNGVIPNDAVPGGHDVVNNTTYIGQGYCNKVGLLTGTIYRGKRGIKLPYGSYSTDVGVGVKILCSSNIDCFSWENAESASLHSTSIGKHLVIGGCEDNKMINVGRSAYQGELIVGKVLGYEAEKAKLCFVHENKEISVNSYQVLVYSPSN